MARDADVAGSLKLKDNSDQFKIEWSENLPAEFRLSLFSGFDGVSPNFVCVKGDRDV